MAHTNAPLDARNVDVVAGTEVVDVTNLSARLECLDSVLEGLAAAAVDADAVNALAAGELHDLLPDWAVLVGNEVGCAVALSCLNADWTGTNSNDARSTVECSTSNGHEADRSNADDQDGVAELNASQLNCVEASWNHVGKDAGVCWIHALWHVSEVAVSVVYVEVLGEDAVLEVGELPASKHATGVHGVASLSLKGVPVWSNCRNEDAVARLEVLDALANLDNLCGALMTKDHVVTVTDCALPQSVNVRCTNCDRKWLADCVQRTTLWCLLLNPAGLADLEHCITLHKTLLKSVFLQLKHYLPRGGARLLRDTDEANKRFCESSHTSVRGCCGHKWVLSTTNCEHSRSTFSSTFLRKSRTKP